MGGKRQVCGWYTLFYSVSHGTPVPYSYNGGIIIMKVKDIVLIKADSTTEFDSLYISAGTLGIIEGIIDEDYIAHEYKPEIRHLVRPYKVLCDSYPNHYTKFYKNDLEVVDHIEDPDWQGALIKKSYKKEFEIKGFPYLLRLNDQGMIYVSCSCCGHNASVDFLCRPWHHIKDGSIEIV
jgi:hypothetical protein